MKRVYQVTAIVFLCLAAYIIFTARDLNYYTRVGPGPGFFPFWLGSGLALLSVIWLGQVSHAPAGPIPKDLIPNWAGLGHVGAILIALVLFLLLVDTLGFIVSMFSFLLFLLFALGRQNLLVTLGICLAGSWGLFSLFTGYLQVHLPPSTIPLLAGLGL